MEIRSGPARVLDSGMVTGFGGQPLVFRILVGEEIYPIEMCFEQGAPEDPVAVRSELLHPGMRLHLVNFDGADGRGSAVPVLLGELGDLLLFMHFRVFKYGNTEDRTVHYTFYQAEKGAVGWRDAAEPAGGYPSPPQETP